MRRNRWIVPLLVCAVAICGIVAGVYQYRFQAAQPSSLIEDTTQVAIGIDYNPDYGNVDAEFERLQEVDRAAVLECLSRYEKQETREEIPGYEMRSVVFDISVYYNEGPPAHIVLGDENFYYDSGKWSYEILNGEQLREELLEILGLPK